MRSSRARRPPLQAGLDDIGMVMASNIPSKTEVGARVEEFVGIETCYGVGCPGRPSLHRKGVDQCCQRRDVTRRGELSDHVCLGDAHWTSSGPTADSVDVGAILGSSRAALSANWIFTGGICSRGPRPLCD